MALHFLMRAPANGAREAEALVRVGCESNDQWADRWYSDHCAKLAASIERYERNSQQQVRSIIKQEYEKNRARWESTCRMVPK